MSAASPSARTFAARRKAALGSRFGVLITSPTNVRYLTGFTGDSTALLLWKDGGKRHERLISDGRFETQIAEQCPGIEAVIRSPSTKMNVALAEQMTAAISDPGSQAFLVEPSAMSAATYFDLADGATHEQFGAGYAIAHDSDATLVDRSIKDTFEIASIRRAVRAAERVFDYMRHRLTPTIFEWELAADGEHVARQFGMKGWAFDAIVAAGDRAALPHYEPGDVSMDQASHLLIDWGVREPGGYVSDMTRVLLRKKTPAKLDRIYDAVLAAHRESAAALRPGVTGGQVDAVARKSLEDAGYGKRFTHSLGHGIGLDVHESPGLRQTSTDELKPGMVVTIEPGVYLPGYGGVRLEDDYLITEDGAESLCSLPLDADANRLDW